MSWIMCLTQYSITILDLKDYYTMSFFEEISEFWISANYTFKFFSKHDVDEFLASLNGEDGMPPKGTNVMFRHVELKHPVSKTHIINMPNDEMKLFLEIIDNDK